MLQQTILLACALLSIILLLKIITAPIRLGYKLAINLASGYLLLFLFNLFSGLTGFVLDLNLIAAAVIGLFGLPGLALILFIRLLFLI